MDLPAAHGAAAVHARGGARAAIRGGAEHRRASAILIERETGTVLYEKNADERLSPASVTKIMTLLLIFEQLDSGQLSTDTVVTASANACAMGGSQIWLRRENR